MCTVISPQYYSRLKNNSSKLNQCSKRKVPNNVVYELWVLVSELGQSEGEGAGVLGV